MCHQDVTIKHVETHVWTNYWKGLGVLRRPFHGDPYSHSALDVAIFTSARMLRLLAVTTIAIHKKQVHPNSRSQ